MHAWSDSSSPDLCPPTFPAIKTFLFPHWESYRCTGASELVRLHQAWLCHVTCTALDASNRDLQAPLLPLPAGVHATSVSWGKKNTFMYKSVSGLKAQEGNKIRKGGRGFGGLRVFNSSSSLPWSHINVGNFSPYCSISERGKGTLLQFSIKSSYQKQEAAASVPCPEEFRLPLLCIEMPRLFGEQYSLNRIDLCPLYSILQGICMLWIHSYTYSLTSVPTHYLDQRYLKMTFPWPVTCLPLLLYNMQPITDLSVKLLCYQNNKSQLARWHLGGIQFASLWFSFFLFYVSYLFPFDSHSKVSRDRKSVV